MHDPAVAIRIAGELKTIGTSLLQKGNLEKAQAKCKASPLRIPCDPSYTDFPLNLYIDQKALKYMNVHPYVPPGDLNFEATWMTLRLQLLLNSSLVALKTNTPSSLRLAIEQATKALDIHSDPVEAGTQVPMTKKLTEGERAKALFRRGSARAQLKDIDEAITDLTEAAKLVPSDAGIQAELKKAQGKKDELKKKQQKAYSKMFG